MKQLHIYLIVLLLIFLSACETDLLKTMIKDGTSPVLTASSAQITLLRADSANNAVSFSWTDPKYLEDTKNGNVVGKYFLEIDKSTDFSKPTIVEMGNELQQAFNVYKLNKLAIKLGCETDVATTLYARVKSLFFNSDSLVSNVLSFSVTPYSTVIPPAIAVPAALYITGDATANAWNKPIPDNQKFTQLTATSFMITIDLKANSQYALITDGTGENWTPCYKIDPNIDPATVTMGGTFVQDGNGSVYNWSSKNFISPAKDGTFKLTFNFQDATFTVVDVTGASKLDIPAELYIVGDATAAAWGDVSSQKFTKESSTVFSITIDLKGNSAYALITDPTGKNWTPCYRLDPNLDPSTVTMGGTFVQDGEGSKYAWSTKNFLSPADDGTYKLTFDFDKGTYTVVDFSGPPAIAVPTALYIIGDATAAAWGDVTAQQLTQVSKTVFSITIDLIGGKAYALVTDPTGKNWTPCYRLDPNLDPSAVVWSGSFVWDGDGSSYSWSTKNFVAPPDDGTYKLTYDFQTATYKVEGK